METPRRTEDGTYPNVTEEREKLEKRAATTTDPDPKFGVLIYDRGQIEWAFFGALSRNDAEREFIEWDRVTGADSHKTIPLGIAPYVKDPTDDQLLMLIESCLMLNQIARRDLHVHEDKTAKRISNWLTKEKNRFSITPLNQRLTRGDWRSEPEE